jgi:hypothetical protein
MEARLYRNSRGGFEFHAEAIDLWKSGIDPIGMITDAKSQFETRIKGKAVVGKKGYSIVIIFPSPSRAKSFFQKYDMNVVFGGFTDDYPNKGGYREIRAQYKKFEDMFQ